MFLFWELPRNYQKDLTHKQTSKNISQYGDLKNIRVKNFRLICLCPKVFFLLSSQWREQPTADYSKLKRYFSDHSWKFFTLCWEVNLCRFWLYQQVSDTLYLQTKPQVAKVLFQHYLIIYWIWELSFCKEWTCETALLLYFLSLETPVLVCPWRIN